MKIFYYLAVFTIIGCGKKAEEEVITNTKLQDKATSVFTSISRQKLPVSGKCNQDLSLTETDKITGINGLPPDVEYGRLLKENQAFGVLMLYNTHADYQLPYIATISASGTIIDKKEMYSISCLEDGNYFGTAAYTVSKDLIIIKKDSSSSYERNENGDILRETIKAESHDSVFFIDSKGMIKSYKD